MFVRTKSRAYQLTRALARIGHLAVYLHGGQTQKQHKQALERFCSESHPVMVATDLARRSIEIIDIGHVINYDVSQACDGYIHRIRCTDRAGNQGIAISFVVLGDREEEQIVL